MLKILFEAYENGSWWDCKVLMANGGKFTVHFKGEGDIEMPSEFLRLRTRKACEYDCNSYLRQGMDVAVFCLHPYADNPDLGLNAS
eukprot:c22160_g1_i2 orf=185-442(+)